MTKITRIEVIDENGRSYVNRGDDNDVSYELQDDGRTLKVFVNKESKMTLKDEGKFYFVHYNHKLYHRMEYTHIPVVWWFENVNTLENPVPLHKKVMDGELIKTLEQLYQEQIVEETAQERGDRIHKEVEELLSEDENEWKSVALRFGEQLVSIGPCGYYDFTPDEWLEWALNAYEKLADDWLSLLKKEKIKQEKVEKSVVEKLLPDDYPYKIADEHGETNPYKQYLNSVEDEKKMEELGFVKSSDGNWTAQPLGETAQEKGERVHKEMEEKLQEKEWSIKVVSDYLTGKSRHKLNIVDKDGNDYKPEPITTEELLKPNWEPKPQTEKEVEEGLRNAMRQAKKDGVFDEKENDKNFKNSLDLIKEWGEKNKPKTLYQIFIEWWDEDWGNAKEICIDKIIDKIDKEFIPPSHDTNDYQWNKCLKLMREKLR